MQAVLCDICALPIQGRALELQSVWGEAVQAEEGRPRIVARSTSSMHVLCTRCGEWTQAALYHLRASVSAATAAATAGGAGPSAGPRTGTGPSTGAGPSGPATLNPAL